MTYITDKVHDYGEDIIRETMTDISKIEKGTVYYKGIIIPQTLGSKLLKRSGAMGKSDEIAQHYVGLAMKEKTFVLHGIKQDDKTQWYALTSDKFRPIMPKQVLGLLEKITDTKPLIRQYESDSSIDFNFPIECDFPGLYARVSMGKYGLFGGNGESALRYGISWLNGLCTNWTLFLPENLDVKERIIHINKEADSIDDLANRFRGLFDFKDTVIKKIDESKQIVITRDTLEDYLNLYAKKRGLNKGVMERVMENVSERTSLYDISFDMTLFCQKLTRSDISRKHIEYLAGELLISYDRILETVQEEKKKEKEQAKIKINP